MKSTNYNIAHHSFRLSMDSCSPLWEYLDNYRPFVVEKEETTPTLTLSVTNLESIDRTPFKPILTSKCKEKDVITFEIYKSDRGEYLITIKSTQSDAPNGSLLFNADFKDARLQLFGSEALQACTLNRAIMIFYLLAVAEQATMIVHASVIKSDDKGYLFMGKSGIGKSTHNALWCTHIPHSELINDDKPIVRIIDGAPFVFGSPWSGKTPCYRNIELPIGGFIRLKQAKENKIRKLNPIESYASLMSSGSGMPWEKELADAKDRILQRIIITTPCWVLECLPDKAAALLCANTVKQND